MFSFNDPKWKQQWYLVSNDMCVCRINRYLRGRLHELTVDLSLP